MGEKDKEFLKDLKADATGHYGGYGHYGHHGGYGGSHGHHGKYGGKWIFRVKN